MEDLNVLIINQYIGYMLMQISKSYDLDIFIFKFINQNNHILVYY